MDGAKINNLGLLDLIRFLFVELLGFLGGETQRPQFQRCSKAASAYQSVSPSYINPIQKTALGKTAYS